MSEKNFNAHLGTSADRMDGMGLYHIPREGEPVRGHPPGHEGHPPGELRHHPGEERGGSEECHTEQEALREASRPLWAAGGEVPGGARDRREGPGGDLRGHRGAGQDEAGEAAGRGGGRFGRLCGPAGNGAAAAVWGDQGNP